MISLNTNLPAQSAANSFNNHYAKLATSAQRLSTGLRINSAADDASGLAVRELMRTDIAAIHQGVRNASDAISMIQVADGALGVIDEKLIRMKELAEQAATGTYDSTQRLLIDSEFQAMGEEIDRIARATDFNGIKLLDYKKAAENGGIAGDTINDTPTAATYEINASDLAYNGVIQLNNIFSFGANNGQGAKVLVNGAEVEFGVGIENKNRNGILTINADGSGSYQKKSRDNYIDEFDITVMDEDGDTAEGKLTFSVDNPPLIILPDDDPSETVSIEIKSKLLNLEDLNAASDIPTGKVKIHFGPMNDAAEDYYYIDRHDATRTGLGLNGVKVQTQDEAQSALVTINDAIVAKDKIRAEYGTMQNRLENTITNLTIQAENLQAAESRISDADIATEMTEFVRNQVLAQSAIAMIAQANSMPQIAMRLIA